jgi:DNA mismatch endonuclease, patch repair protein
MPDVFTVEKRSEVMSRIRARGNRDTELRMISLFRQFGIAGWRRNARVFGKPHFVFPYEKIAVFVDGCFWHRHPGCRFAYTPKSRREFWSRKFESNVARDKSVMRALRKAGWRIARVWECELSRHEWPKIARRVERLRTKRQTTML